MPVGVLLGKSKWGLSNGGLRPLSAISTQSSTIMHFCGLFWPAFCGELSSQMRTIVGNRGQLWTSTLSPHLLSPPFRLSRFWSENEGDITREPVIGLDVPIRGAQFAADRIAPIRSDLISQRAQRSKKFNLARNFQSRSKCLISLENFIDFPTKNGAAGGGSLENFILAPNFQSRSKSRFF